MCFILLQEPYNNVDDVFFEKLGSFPQAEIPKDPAEFLIFKTKVEELLAIANINQVDVYLKDDNGHHFAIVKTLEEFEQEYEILETLEHSGTPDLPVQGNYWAFSNQPFTLSVKNVYDNVEDEFNYSEKPELELPDSKLDKAHKLSGSELRIVDRLSKYGESFPFLNEDGSFSDAALADIDELLMTEATDADLLNFIKDGIDAVDRVGEKVGKLAGKAKDAVVGTGKMIGKAAKWVDKKVGVTSKGQKEKLKELIAKELGKIDTINVNKAAKDAVAGKNKEDSKPIRHLEKILSNADGVANKLEDKGDSSGAKKIDKAVENTRKEYRETQKDLKAKEKGSE